MLEVGLGYNFRLSVNSAESESGGKKVSEVTGTRGSVLWAPEVPMPGSIESLYWEAPAARPGRGSGWDALGFRPPWLVCTSVGR